MSTAAHRPASDPALARAFVTTFDRILIAGFLAEPVSDRGRDVDVNGETSRLLRMTLRTQASLNVIESQPLNLPQTSPTTANPDDAVFRDVPFWRRIGEEYRQPLILTGTVRFRRAGSQSEERAIGPRSVTVSRPRFRLDVKLVFISGRTGEMLDSLTLGPVAMQAADGRTSALGLYFELMDRLAPSVLAAFGHQTGMRRTSR